MENTNTSRLSKLSSISDWEEYAPGIKSTEQNEKIISDKKNALFLTDVIRDVQTQPIIDFEI